MGIWGGGGVTKLDYLGVISIHFRSLFFQVKVQNGNILGGLLKYKIFYWVCLIFLILFGVNSLIP